MLGFDLSQPLPGEDRSGAVTQQQGAPNMVLAVGAYLIVSGDDEVFALGSFQGIPILAPAQAVLSVSAQQLRFPSKSAAGKPAAIPLSVLCGYYCLIQDRFKSGSNATEVLVRPPQGGDRGSRESADRCPKPRASPPAAAALPLPSDRRGRDAWRCRSSSAKRWRAADGGLDRRSQRFGLLGG
jgi:hypothetical protein